MNLHTNEEPQFDDITMNTNLNQIEYDESIFEAKDEALNDVNNFLEERLDNANVDIRTKNQIFIAVEEIFTNVAHHGYENADGKVKILISTSDNNVVIVFKDSGVPFNPLNKEDPNIALSASERDIGGLGIFMTKRLMDSFSYDFVDGQNVVTIEKSYER